jgi:fatty acid desaturase
MKGCNQDPDAGETPALPASERRAEPDTEPLLNARAANADRALRDRVRLDLPPSAFALHPWRLLWGLPLVALIAGGSAGLVVWPVPWYLALPASAGIGCLYASLFFFGHEVAHGAVVRSRRIQQAVLYVTGLVYAVSPHLWMVWHNEAHHGHTNMPDHDPDTFGTLEEFRQRRFSQVFARFAPGSGHWLSALYLFSFFTLQCHGVLWFNSFRPPFRRLNRRRAALDSLAMAAFWIAVAVMAGPRGALFAVVIPMLTVNCVMLSYVVTNHMMRSLADGPDSLATTMSVSTWKALDLLYFNFSHHVEHHLFPSMSPRYYPLVRRSLRRHAGDRYLAPGHWQALRQVYRTPRFYADAGTLARSEGDVRVPVRAIDAALRVRPPAALFSRAER